MRVLVPKLDLAFLGNDTSPTSPIKTHISPSSPLGRRSCTLDYRSSSSPDISFAKLRAPVSPSTGHLPLSSSSSDEMKRHSMPAAFPPNTSSGIKGNMTRHSRSPSTGSAKSNKFVASLTSALQIFHHDPSAPRKSKFLRNKNGAKGPPPAASPAMATPSTAAMATEAELPAAEPSIPIVIAPLSSSPPSIFSLDEQVRAEPMLPAELAQLLHSAMESKLRGPLIIDMRDLVLYDQAHIRTALNVNLPSLMIKRFRRGKVHHFSLEGFITTPAGRAAYRARSPQAQESSRGILTSESTIIVLDEVMNEAARDSVAWTLLDALETMLSEAPGRSRLCWLRGGHEAFCRDHKDLLASSETDEPGDDQMLQPKVELKRRHTTGCKGKVHNSIFNLDTSRKPASLSNLQTREVQPAKRAGLRRMATIDLGKPPLRIFTLDPLDTSCRCARGSNSSELSSASSGRRVSAGTSCSGSFFSSSLVTTPSTSPDSCCFSPMSPASPCSICHRPVTSHSHAEGEEPSRPLTSTPVMDVSEILPGFLFLGPELTSPQQLERLSELGVRRILNMAEECNDAVLGLEKFTYRKVSAQDHVEMRGVEQCLEEAVNFIDDARRANEPIYVHCFAGRSRSVTAVLAFLIRRHRWTLRQAYDHVLERRPGICPNIGFVAELMRIEEGELGQVSQLGTPSLPYDSFEMEGVGME
ncbi:uncharacterized protein VTP21DRAFT_4256 [Calcarisporiella thermophila]|uniref:uncharacterized protein n=1 Tax=Calcarisporiella thermophila TaxID=911321 RepID=UPI003742A653